MPDNELPAVCVIDVVGLTLGALGPETPTLCRLRDRGCAVPLQGIVPAVTCSAQATLLTGTSPSDHGVVGNGWLYRDTREVRFWQQSRSLIEADPVYESARRRALARNRPFQSAKLFWWFNQGAVVDLSVTPKPHYGADGSKRFGISGTPDGLTEHLEKTLGPFPFPAFWGPMAGLGSSDWIARATARVLRDHRPHLTLSYLPHLDYDLQRFGPGDPRAKTALREVDECLRLILEAADEMDVAVVAVSEYGIVPVHRPIALNRMLREKGWLVVRDGPFGEVLETFQSRAFAVADHQIAHVYVSDPSVLPRVKEALEGTDGVARVLGKDRLSEVGLDHPRSGELVAFSEPDAWFSYPYWLDSDRAPDFARTVDIHRKPGYDPCELFFDPRLRSPKMRVIGKLLRKKLGFRTLMDLVPLDPGLIRGSHGLLNTGEDRPVLVTNRSEPFSGDSFPMTGFRQGLLELLDLS